MIHDSSGVGSKKSRGTAQIICGSSTGGKKRSMEDYSTKLETVGTDARHLGH
jgi:hypothetical protein